jgi:lipopolysaccharide/colanic/teichoic acid biosynthesis glycosyltransferase
MVLARGSSGRLGVEWVEAPLKTYEPSDTFERRKRAIDILFGLPLALLALPVMAILALAVMVSLRTWRPIFVQDRVGRHGALFRLPKLRTLPLTTPPYADKYAIHDLRIPRLCRLLRRTHLDELPQLLLVPLGKMSLVGPRPEMPGLAAQFEPEFAAVRCRVRPGCTGLWQVSDETEKLIQDAPEYDLYYVRKRSLRFDLWIMWRTLVALVPATPRVSLGPSPSSQSSGGNVVALPRRIPSMGPSTLGLRTASPALMERAAE